MKLAYLKVNGEPVSESTYHVTEKSLTIKQLPLGPLQLEIGTDVKPQENSLLEGLYKSGGNFCTQVGELAPLYVLSTLVPSLSLSRRSHSRFKHSTPGCMCTAGTSAHRHAYQPL